LLLHLADDPWRAVPDRVNAGIRAEAGPNRACEELPSGDFGPAIDRAREDRRFAALGVRQANLRLSPKDSLTFPFVLLAGVRLDHRDHAAVRLSDNIFVLAGRLGKSRGNPGRFEDALGMAERDPLHRALAYLEAVVFPQFAPRLRERIVGGQIDDRALQGPRTASRGHPRAARERPYALAREPILRL
jgi:hypothetical protein